MFQKYVHQQLDRVKACPQAAMLSQEVYAKFEERLNIICKVVSKSTMLKYMAEELSGENPFASVPALIPEEQKKKAKDSIKEKLDSGVMTLPAPLTDILDLRLNSVTNAFLEMISRIDENRVEICNALTDGKLYTKIEDIQFSAGDTHNHGRSVAILQTDVGKLVYKPRNLCINEQLYFLVERFFPEFVGIPKCIAFEGDFGVCEFIEKKRAEGEEEAKQFWYALGGLTAFIKMLNSIDMHFENILCSGTKPYLIDLETLLVPAKNSRGYQPCFVSLMPARRTEIEISPLINTSESGCAPVVNGKKVTVTQYLSDYKKGYHDAYTRIVSHREEIAEIIRSFPEHMAVRVLIRSSLPYVQNMMRLYHHSALESEKSYQEATAILSEIFHNSIPKDGEKIADSEVRQILHGDIPYMYTYVKSCFLFSDGEEVYFGMFDKSASENVLGILYSMNEKDELFDLTFIERAIRQYPEQFSDIETPENTSPERTEMPLPAKTALQEAKNLFEELYALHIPAPDGKLLWGSMSPEDCSFSFCGAGFATGMTGIAVFTAAYAYVSNDDHTRTLADTIMQETISSLETSLEKTISKNNASEYSIDLGEASGVGGILTGLALLRQYAPQSKLDELQKKWIELLSAIDFSKCDSSDRISGLTGLLTTLCRFAEYRHETDIIRKVADRLLELKTLEYHEKTLWKTISDKERPISGAGHGHAGIAQALFAVANVLDDEKYIPAAEEALSFEYDIYEKYAGKFGTWADLRSYPPEKYMNGYCSGAPGIGIMMERIQKIGTASKMVKTLSQLAGKSVDALPLNVRDHLCCGNSSIVEYYLSTDRIDTAGKVLGAIYDRKLKENSYRYMSYDRNNGVTPSLFYGIGGIGYEMLRYAFPDKILSLF